jgi:trimethylamine--corrinoid protein Co-methyltransferase
LSGEEKRVITGIRGKAFSFNSDISVSQIHELSVRIMHEIGVPIKSVKALDLLKETGCTVDRERGVVFISERVVMESLKKARSHFSLFDRSTSREIAIGGDNVSFMSGAAAIRVCDLNGVYREPTLRDLVDMTKVQDYLENIDVIHELVEPSDIDPRKIRVRMAALLLTNTTKPCAFVVEGPGDVEDICRIGVTIRGGRKELEEKPLFSIHDISAEATIGIVREQCDALMKCAELGIPTGIGAYPIMGSTGPVTIEGALALANANILSALVIAQTIRPGIPFLYMIMAGSLDMKKAEMITASPEIWAYYIAGKKLAEYYRLPSHCIISADSKSTDIQLAMEKYSALFIASLCGINLIHGTVCQSDAMNGANYDQMLIDNEIVSMVKYMVDSLRSLNGVISKEEIFNDIKTSLENKMYFMDSDTTVGEFKKRLWESNLLVRENFDRWKDGGMKSILDNSREKTSEIIETYKVEPLDSNTEREIDSIVQSSIRSSEK